MSIFDWLKRRLAGDSQAELKISAEEDELSGLSMKQVIEAHMAWIERLKKVLDGTSEEQLEVEKVSVDNLCVLGKWIYGPAQQLYGKLPEYQDLKKTHADFHRCAGQVLTDHNNCQHDHAYKRLKGDFRGLSGRIQLDLVSLYARAKRH